MFESPRQKDEKTKSTNMKCSDTLSNEETIKNLIIGMKQMKVDIMGISDMRRQSGIFSN